MKSNTKHYQTLLWSLEGQWVALATWVILGFLGRGLVLASGSWIAAYVDFLLGGARSSHWALWLKGHHEFFIGLIVLLSSGLLCTWIFRIQFSHLNALMISHIHDEVALRVSRFPMSFFDQTPVGRIVTRFSSDYGSAFRLFGGPLAEFLSIVFDLIWIALILVGTHWGYALSVIVGAIGYYAIYRRWAPYLRHNREELSKRRAPSIAHFAETLQGSSIIRWLFRESSFTTRFSQEDRLYLDQKWKTQKTLAYFTLALNGLSLLLYILVALLSWWGIERGWTTWGDLGLSLGLITLSSNSIQMFFEWLAQFEEANVGVMRLDDYLRRPLEQAALLPDEARFPTPEHQKHRLSPSFTSSKKDIESQNFTWNGAIPNNHLLPISSIQWKHVYFRYKKDGPWILQDIHIELPQAKIGIVGQTGSGKSSFVQILAHLYPIEKGEIELGPFKLPITQPSMDLGIEALRQQLAFIPQDPLILQGSLRDNIDPDGRLAESDYIQLLSELAYEPWLRQPHLMIYEKGSNLSVGERQLIQLARTMISPRPVLLLDEATSNMDPQTEGVWSRLLESKMQGRLSLIIAHRLQTLESCDYILWLDHGRIRDWGKPEQVLPQFKNQSINH
ncbi:MAG: ABC transporter ATP-binding protein/permease [Bdellovibrionaceae bacterium]|jgi:ABC-type multidrug transport system fused ATPase/permease subunit|nr:ABC transporter ATP-binding protein/permease [Pseudobdellovibrionaceae bacterium]